MNNTSNHHHQQKRAGPMQHQNKIKGKKYRSIENNPINFNFLVLFLLLLLAPEIITDKSVWLLNNKHD